MPFTPYHMGPGILIKSVLQGGFSLMVFGWSQIVMDLQPLFVLIKGEGHLHGFSHTYIGATLLAVFSATTGKYLSELGLKILKLDLSAPVTISWRVAIVSATVGCFSHVFIDSIMHADMVPFYPFSDSNGLLKWVSTATLHKLCLYTGLVGALIFFGIHVFRKVR